MLSFVGGLGGENRGGWASLGGFGVGDEGMNWVEAWGIFPVARGGE